MFPKNFNDQSHLPMEGALVKSNTILTAYRGTGMQHCGIVEIPCKFKGKELIATLNVTDAPGNAMLALTTCQKLQLIKFNHIINKQAQDPSGDGQTIIDNYPNPAIPRIL